jgi:hypothetical protein
MSNLRTVFAVVQRVEGEAAWVLDEDDVERRIQNDRTHRKLKADVCRPVPGRAAPRHQPAPPWD